MRSADCAEQCLGAEDEAENLGSSELDIRRKYLVLPATAPS